MANAYKLPGVYVEEVTKLPTSISGVPTAVPAFIGYTQQALRKSQSITHPTRISSLAEYETLFGNAQPETAFSVTINESNTGGIMKRTVDVKLHATDQSRFKMYYALQLYFANGGGPCYIVSVGDYSAAPAADKLEGGLERIAGFDEPTLLLFPDAFSLDADQYYALMKKALDQCALLQDRFTIMDVLTAEGPNVVAATMTAFRNAAALGNERDILRYGAAYFPGVETVLHYRYNERDVKVRYVKDGKELTIVDADTRIEDLRMSDLKKPRVRLQNNLKAGLKLPNIELYNHIRAELQKITVRMPSSPAVAGVYARVDRERGVWKAPANECLNYVTAPGVKISEQEQMLMNVDATFGKSVNAIRYFSGKGVLVWGARTLAGNDNEWRYVPVRRFCNFVFVSIQKGTEMVVFEPNNATTWVRVKAMIENFLTPLWRDGALAGAKPEHAFFVQVGLGTTMTEQDILEGRMNIEIGLAVVKPAEFIVLRFSHQMQES